LSNLMKSNILIKNDTSKLISLHLNEENLYLRQRYGLS
jgi:hypothetical protein